MLKFIRRLFCKHRDDPVCFTKLPYGYKVIFVCKKCGRKRITIC